MLTKYEQYYNKISDLVEKIQMEEDYLNKSMAFNHWFLQSMYDFTDQEIAESIVDGGGDNGIDSIICDEENKSLTVFQFKFPNNPDQLDKEISLSDILKTLSGFDILRGKLEMDNSNNKFKEFKDRLKGVFIEKFKIVFVSFNNGVVNNKEQVESYKESFIRETGSSMEIEYIDKLTISNLFEKKTRTTSVKADVPYKIAQQAYSTGVINSFVGVLDAIKLIESIEDKMLTIFDENIRLLENNSSVNDQIRETASDENFSDMFYFYNNGIVFICDHAVNSPNSLTLSLEGASIVNGCQTVNSLYQVYKEGKLHENVSLLFRVIVIADYDERSRITSYLNSQNSIKGSYFIANHSIIRDLQDDLKPLGYYLERQKNERNYKVAFGETIDSMLKQIKLEDMIQYYSGYWIDSLASLSKRGKGALFETDNINEILSNITADRVIESFDMYSEIALVITKYRKMRRNELNEEFSEYLNIEQENLIVSINEYLFMNTADILLLNVCKSLKESLDTRGKEYSTAELIRNAIYLSRDVIKPHLTIDSPATLTKKSDIFEEARSKTREWVMLQ
ncbi:AIPR family protein [Erysipelothrix rhusiopathiae]|uniref:Abortive phage infection protein C-terminal domain-containing protein n=1 Tax=Erysipelothrix rhusiopathiae ATCC 19414 TaxID=525280 RepID=E7FVR9_ERYRH|nr:AIPR family protein [Erysipelothrix rhusiopathiae]EFY08989.1 hypothetical protein HMPREF0357_11096 [Erysipelothrix rhusiopathiae ATCC 19414]VEH83480.1 AIPR protein [Erysipelothrix rhusiopathiae]